MGRFDYITPQGAKVLRDELRELWEVERPRVTQEVADAAAQGDRSENAAYTYGKKRLREIDRRVRFLGKRLEALTVVEPADRGDGKVYFGAWVTVADEDGEETTYRLVGPDEFDVGQGAISIKSPVARALMGREVGDIATVRTPKGAVELEVVSVRWQPA